MGVLAFIREKGTDGVVVYFCDLTPLGVPYSLSVTRETEKTEESFNKWRSCIHSEGLDTEGAVVVAVGSRFTSKEMAQKAAIKELKAIAFKTLEALKEL